MTFARQFLASGITNLSLLFERPLWLFPDVAANFNDRRKREPFLTLVRRLEQEPSLLGVSAHLLAIARKE